MQKKIFYFIGLAVIIHFCTISAAFADTLDEDRGLEDNMTFHVYDDVDLVSTLKFEYGKPRIIIKSVYPQLASETEHEGVAQFNELALQKVTNEITRYRNLVKENASTQKTLDKKTISNNLYIDYNTSYIKPGNDHIISIRFGMQGSISGTNASYHEYSSMNYDMDNNTQIELSELFQPGTNYLDIISRYAYGILQKRLQNNARTSGAAPRADNYLTWNIKPNGLFFTFNEGQVAPKMFGTQTVLVPWSELKEIIAPDSYVAICVDHPEKCARHNLLTGGFIDEAVNSSHGRLDPVLG